MSVAKITTVGSARKIPGDGQCEKCQKPVGVGDPYRWFAVGFRNAHKRVLCLDYACTPKRSELESSKLSTVYAAQEEAESNISVADCSDDIESAVQAVGEACREIAEEYREAGTNPDTGVEFNPDMIERADSLESSADELESWETSIDRESCEMHNDDWVENYDHDKMTELEKEEAEKAGEATECTCDETLEHWMDAMREEANEAINDLVEL